MLRPASNYATVVGAAATTSARRKGIAKSPIAVCFYLACISPSLAVDKAWNTASDTWSTPTNWTPAGVPANGDVVRIGNLAGVQNSTVFLDQNDTIAELHLSDGMGLQLDGHWMVVNGDTTLTGEGTRLNIANAVAGSDFETDNLVVGSDADVYMTDAAVHINEQLDVNGGAFGSLFSTMSLVELSAAGGTTLSNDGQLRCGPGILQFFQTNGGRYDLDGTGGDGELFVSGVSDAYLAFIGEGLTDAFSGLIKLGPFAHLHMSLADGWSADSSSTIEVFGGVLESEVLVSGNHVCLNGFVDVGGLSDLRFSAPTTLDTSFHAEIGTDATLTFDGSTTVDGGAFTYVAADSGEVRFGGPTTWQGNATFGGHASQSGVATVAAATVIDGQSFELDRDGTAVWNIEAPLVLNTVKLATFHGVINVGGNVLNKLTLNLAGGPQSAWWMDGQLNLSGSKLFFVNRLAGSYVLNKGETNISDSNVEISAGMLFMPEAVVNFATADSDLRMRGETSIREGATFHGEGTLQNGIGGEMYLHHGANLGDVGLINAGDVGFRRYNYPNLAGLVAVDRFTNDDEGTVHFRLGGDILGEEFDHLSVTGGAATLDGLIDVQLIDDGSGQFLPQIGDEFMVLTAVGGVSGQFLNAPVSHAAGKHLHWTVLYHPYDVTLRLDSVTVPEPASLAAALVATAGVLGRTQWRRRQPESLR